MEQDRIILPITPQTAIRTTQNVKILFRIPEVCYKGVGGKGCVMYHKTGLCKHTLSHQGRRRKRRIERYNKYKLDFLHLAKMNNFKLPSCGWSLYFYLPIAKNVSKWKRELLHGQMHLATPDIDNLIKAIFDSLSITDEQTSQLSGIGKFWVDTGVTKDRNGKKKVGPGWIEILTNQPIYNPFGVTFIDEKTAVKMKDEQTQRNKMIRKEQPVVKKRRRNKTLTKSRQDYLKHIRQKQN